MGKPTLESSDRVILSVLVYEFSSKDHATSAITIKERLKYYRLGDFSSERVERIRCLKNGLQREIRRHRHSDYYIGPSTKSYRDEEDYDVPRIVTDYAAEFPDVLRSDVEWFVSFAVYAYYLR